MRILNIGSLNIDKIYRVKYFVRPKETIKAIRYEETYGGKGLNQSVALGKAGVNVFHAGAIGSDGGELLGILQDAGVCTELIQHMEAPSGHAVIQVDETGQNNIIICGGTNDSLSKEYIEIVLARFERGDAVLLQNEVSNVDYAIRRAKERGLTVILNPSPMNESINSYDLGCVDLFILNEVEGKALCKTDSDEPRVIINALKEKFPQASFVLTLGEKGSYYFNDQEEFFQDIFRVEAVDTTGAGDTFCGYFLAGLADRLPYQECLKNASAASAIEIGRMGAACGIPEREEVRRFLQKEECIERRCVNKTYMG